MTTRKSIPEALYPCVNRFCAEERSWPATDLWWSEREQGWLCDDCWNESSYYGDADREKPGISLADEIAAQQQQQRDWIEGDTGT